MRLLRIELPGYTLVNYVSLTYDQKVAVLAMRNDDRVRVRMDNPDPIVLDAHLAFIEKLRAKDKDYLAIFNDGELIGSVNFEYDGDTAERGVFISPDHGHSGHAARVLAMLNGVMHRYAGINTIIARVKADNLPSIKLQGRLGGSMSGSDGTHLHFKYDIANNNDNMLNIKVITGGGKSSLNLTFPHHRFTVGSHLTQHLMAC